MKNKGLAFVGYAILLAGILLIGYAIGTFGKTITIEVNTSREASDASDESQSVKGDDNQEYIADTEYKSINILSSSAVTYDFSSGGYKLLKNSTTEYSTGAFNLLVTALVTIEKLGPEYSFAVGNELSILPNEVNLAGLQKGDSLSMTMMLDALLVAGGADAAYTMAVTTARAVAGDPAMDDRLAIASFVSMMNTYKKSLSMNSTNFVNPDGSYDLHQTTTAADICKCAIKAMSVTEIMNAVSKKAVTHTFNNGRQVTFKSNNKLLDSSYTAQYFNYANGMLYWQLSDTVNCLIATASIKGSETVSVLLGGEKINDVYTDAIELFYPTLQKAVLN